MNLCATSLRAGLLFCLTVLFSPAHAYSALYVFGDSLSDTGNNALAIGTDPTQVITGNSYVPTFPYASGHYSNGAVWVQDFASRAGLSATPSLAGGGIYAFGGARTGLDGPGMSPSLETQTAMFLATLSGHAPSNGLYVVGGGGNDIRDALAAIALGANPLSTIASTATQYASDIHGIVDDLQAAGAHHIVVWNAPNLGLAPAVVAAGPTASTLGTALAMSMNTALALILAGEHGVQLFDLFGTISGVVSDPAAFGLTNVSDACGALVACDPSAYLFWDGIHPTSAGHQILADAMFAQVPEPQSILFLMAALLALAFIAKRR